MKMQEKDEMEKIAHHILRISKQWMVKIATIPMLVCTIVFPIIYFRWFGPAAGRLGSLCRRV
jgi:hypothetical protein